MNKKLKFTVGTLTYDEKNKFFYGRVNGVHTTVNLAKDKEGKDLWYVAQTLDVWETVEKQEIPNTPGK